VLDELQWMGNNVEWFSINPKMTKNPQQAIILETLYTSLHSPHAEIRARAADALSQMGHLSTAVAAEHQIENLLLTAVADPSPIVRQHVARALGRIGSRRSLEPVVA
jgi:HEAT repeat protein